MECYENTYDFETADRYADEHRRVRQQQKDMVRGKTAAMCDREWVVDGDAKQGRKMIAEQLRLMLRAFNGECDAAIARVKHSNAPAQLNRIQRAFDAINKLGESKASHITHDYLELKIRELRVVYEHQEKKEQEREEQRLIREEMR